MSGDLIDLRPARRRAAAGRAVATIAQAIRRLDRKSPKDILQMRALQFAATLLLQYAHGLRIEDSELRR